MRESVVLQHGGPWSHSCACPCCQCDLVGLKKCDLTQRALCPCASATGCRLALTKSDVRWHQSVTRHPPPVHQGAEAQALRGCLVSMLCVMQCCLYCLAHHPHHHHPLQSHHPCWGSCWLQGGCLPLLLPPQCWPGSSCCQPVHSLLLIT
jgi:hypothetical protein